MESLLEELAAGLRKLDAAGLSRQLVPGRGLDFASNDYLGLANDPALRAAILERLAAMPADEGLGAPASRLLRGTTARHVALEERLARFKGTEAALLFPSGYQANVGLLTAVISPQDRAVSDALNHASLIDGLRLAGCEKVIVPHRDVEAVERALASPWSGRTFLVTESLFSMDGDAAPLARYVELAQRYGAELIVDDAHATGIFGEARGSGLTEGLESNLLAVVSTLGKAVGLAGAFVAGSRTLIDWLVNRSRGFLFTTSLPPLLVIAVDAAFDRMAEEPERRARVLALADRLRILLRAAGCECSESVGPIVPVILGDNRRALAVAAMLQGQGFDVRAARPPTVPSGTARLRICVHANHSEAEIDGLAAAVVEAVRTLR